MPRYLLINQFDCDTLIYGIVNEPTINAVYDLLLKIHDNDDMEDSEKEFFKELATACIGRGVHEIGQSVPAEVQDQEQCLYLINLGE